MNYNDEWGFFFFSEKQLAACRSYSDLTNFCKTQDGQIKQYTEWVSTGIKPSGKWDDYVPLGRAMYHHSQ
jgi:hypothetical protein